MPFISRCWRCSMRPPPPPSHLFQVLLHFQTSPPGKVDMFAPQKKNSLSKVAWDSLNNRMPVLGGQADVNASYNFTFWNEKHSGWRHCLLCFCFVKHRRPFWHFGFEQTQQSTLQTGGYGVCQWTDTGLEASHLRVVTDYTAAGSLSPSTWKGTPVYPTNAEKARMKIT